MEQFGGCYQCKYECDDNCNQCIYGECFQCSQEFNLVNNKCIQKCQETCLNCIQGVCQLCSSGYFLNEYLNCRKIEYDFSCTSECGNGIIEDLEQCDDQNLIFDDSCNNYCELICDINCTRCIDGVCFECKEGWKLDVFFCVPICGDLIVVGNEECDDGNQVPFDGCFQCKYSCTQHCEEYLNGIRQSCLLKQCLKCEFGYYGNKCMPKCGDGIIVQEEECDDGNLNDLDICLNCKQQCPQYCKLCAYGICTQCFNGFYLDIVSNSCNSVCGDNILASDEVCDDGNELRYDGCFQCKYQCQMECLDCQFGKCILCEQPLNVVHSNGVCEQLKSCEDQIGFYYDNYSNDCLPLCGDGIVVSYEQCDDQNSIPYDGCFECKYQCIHNCKVCQEKKCLQCDIDYSLHNNQCSLNKQDHLNSSIIEESQKNNTSINAQNPQWLALNENQICQDYECVYSKKPSMQLAYKNQYQALQYVEITFDQEVKFQQQVLIHQKLFNISIYDLDPQNYNITINSIKDISFNLDNAQYGLLDQLSYLIQLIEHKRQSQTMHIKLLLKYFHHFQQNQFFQFS